MGKNPPIDFKHLAVKAIKNKWDKGELFVNEEYQRSEVWKPAQAGALIDSIEKGFSIGVLVIHMNKDRRLEILDGQQRIRSMVKFLDNDLRDEQGKKFGELSETRQAEIEGYSVNYLYLKSELTEEEISDIFVRLQEGLPLNIAEKVNAFHGRFRKAFMDNFFDNNARFFGKLKNHRFRARLIAAEFLLLELESNFDKKSFPDVKYGDFKRANEKYKPKIPERKLQEYRATTEFLGTYLHDQIGAISPRDIISFYLLASYLRKKQAKTKLYNGVYFKQFVVEFMKNLTSFSIYDTSSPKDMDSKLFTKYMTYKQFGRRADTSESVKRRFNIVLSEYKRIYPKVKFKDPVRLFNEEEKIKIYFKQDSLCAHCGKSLDFKRAECHHKKEHSVGGQTKISNGIMLHNVCHTAIHKAKNLKRKQSTERVKTPKK